MNTLIEKIVREHVEHVPAYLSFVKFNTAGSPKRPMPKVLFFCFFENEAEPRLVLKTVRASRDNAVVVRGYENLEALREFSASVFPEPLWRGEVDGIAWSVETALSGTRAKTSDVQRIVEAYIEFQKSASRSRKNVSADTVARRLFDELAVSRSDAEALWKTVGDKPDVTILPQHGDFTQDNVVIGDTVGFVDTDWYMKEGIAGFDLFHLLSRSKDISDPSSYLRAYEKAIGMDRSFGRADALLWLLQERVLKQAQGSPLPTDDVRDTFEKVCSRFKLA